MKDKKFMFDIDAWRKQTILDGCNPDSFNWQKVCIGQPVENGMCIGTDGNSYLIHPMWCSEVIEPMLSNESVIYVFSLDKFKALHPERGINPSSWEVKCDGQMVHTASMSCVGTDHKIYWMVTEWLIPYKEYMEEKRGD